MSLKLSVYGIPLLSDSSIPGLVSDFSTDAIPGAPVRVCLARVPPEMDPLWASNSPPWYVSPTQPEGGTPTLQVWKQTGGRFFRFRYADDTEFLVRADGGEIAARWPAGMTLEDTATYLLGPILGFVLRLRGVTCLHASAVAINDRAILLMGGPGAGKSTTAAVLAQRGLMVVSDDISALDWREQQPWIQPGYPRLNLWPESVAAAFGRPDGLPLITTGWDKRFVDLTQPPYRFASAPLPLGAVFHLAPESSHAGPPVVETVLPQQALMSLVANTYANYLLDATQRAAEFETLGRLVRCVPVRRVRYRPEPASFSAVPEAIVADCQSRSRSAAGQ